MQNVRFSKFFLKKTAQRKAREPFPCYLFPVCGPSERAQNRRQLLACSQVIRRGLEAFRQKVFRLALLKPIVLGATRLFRNLVGNLRANFNFGFRHPVILPFGLPQEQSTLAVLEFKRILPASTWNLNLSLPHSLRYKISFLVEQGTVSIQNPDRGI